MLKIRSCTQHKWCDTMDPWHGSVEFDIYVCMYVIVDIWVDVGAYINVYVCVYIYIYIYIYVDVSIQYDKTKRDEVVCLADQWVKRNLNERTSPPWRSLRIPMQEKVTKKQEMTKHFLFLKWESKCNQLVRGICQHQLVGESNQS